jgi:hypothetical protein
MARICKFDRRFIGWSGFTMVLLVQFLGCTPRLEVDECNFSLQGAIEVAPEQVIDENTRYDRNTH